MQYPNSHILAVKARVYLHDLTPKVVFEAVYDMKIRAGWDHNFSEMKCMKRFSVSEDIIYSSVKLPFPLSNRDSLKARSYRFSPNTSTYLSVHR